MKTLKHSKAFTIIEILFVIAIIGVMASLGVSFYQHRAENAKISKAALQMQQIMQAALAYKTDNNQWPESTDTNFKDYVPQNGTNDPWGGQYTWSVITHGPSEPSATFFEVIDQTPSNTVATRIAAMLPNSAVNNETVTAQINSNGTNSSEVAIQSIGVGAIDGGSFSAQGTATQKLSVDATCPVGQSMQLITVPYDIENTRIHNDDPTHSDPTQLTDLIVNATRESGSANTFDISATFRYWGVLDPYVSPHTYAYVNAAKTLKFYYIAYCKKSA